MCGDLIFIGVYNYFGLNLGNDKGMKINLTQVI